ncbi:hypothetical protein SCHPADRAFT_902111 [Schizopora paradoxa]|uniref:C2H2-type domain-containing protein n=1 Tax=Schizopora paradoxa TaxID=27342 RepID=A0A0H2S1R4_9AGAM|nr:hypothetical protein SCHPADRAFT_902111 [Schizopora paradoxa]
MSNWPAHAAPLPPPPRDDRSRSPSRGGYGRPFPEPGYPSDSYRGDWDAHGRDRPWHDYERDRIHDYGRRGRSRSPGADDGRKRRRSPSPYDRDRFEPRPRYNDDFDAHSRSMDHHPPRGRGQYGGNYGSRSARAAPVDPHTLDYPASLKQYAEWFRYFFPQQANEEDIADKAAEQEAGDGTKPRNGIKTRWEKYKKEFLATQLQTLFDHHKKSPWFAEKYDPSPEFVSLRTRVRKFGWKGRMNQFLSDLEEGKFDPNSSESEADPNSPMSPTTTRDKENLEMPDAGEVRPEDKKDDDDFGLTMDGDEEAADNGDIKMDMNGKGSLDGKRAHRSDEVSTLPEGNQVMIRTIPPDIGRVKLENAIKDIPGFVYLALGDPMQKRNYYRAGWIKFTEDADMEKNLATLGEKKIEGFKLHVSHCTKPFVNKIRQAPDVASKPDRILKDLEQVKKLASLLEDEYDRVRHFKVESKPQADGDANADASVVRPDGDQDMEESDDEPRERGIDAVERRIVKLHEELPQPADENDMWLWENKKNVIALDLYLAYLRQAFNTCYYCASITDHAEELQRKCIKHIRRPMSKAAIAEINQHMDSGAKGSEEDKAVLQDDQENAEKPKETSEKVKSSDKSNVDGRDWKRNDDRWLDWLDGKIALLLNKDGVDAREYGGKKYDDELTKAVEPFIKQEDEGKFRCKTCLKLFKATSFVEKHIANKHSELLKVLDDLSYFNNFALDPQRIQPFTHPPPLVGNAQAAPPQAFGIQAPPPFMDHGRGMPPPYYGGFPPPQAFPPPYGGGGGWDAYGYHGGYLPPPPPVARSLRDEPPLSSGRRLGDRIGGYAPGHEAPPPRADGGHGIEGLPPKPPPPVESGPPGGRRNGRGGPPPPPPPDAKEDPRAAAGRRVSYHDMDLVAEGDVELQY